MDNSKALVRLTEAADLIAMVDELLAAAGNGSANPSTWSGIRITLRSVRESVLASHDTLAADFIHRARGATGSIPVADNDHTRPAPSFSVNRPQSEGKSSEPRISIGRKDLRSTVEQITST